MKNVKKFHRRRIEELRDHKPRWVLKVTTLRRKVINMLSGQFSKIDYTCLSWFSCLFSFWHCSFAQWHIVSNMCVLWQMKYKYTHFSFKFWTMYICGDKLDISIHITPVFCMLLLCKHWSFLEQFLCIMIFCHVHMITFRCNLPSCTILILSFFFSIYVMSVFFVGVLCQVCVTLFVYLKIKQVHIGKIFILYNPLAKTMSNLYLGCL